MKNQRAWLRLAVISLVAAVFLASANYITKDKILAQAQAAVLEGQQLALPIAQSFEALDGDMLNGLDNCLAGKLADGSVAGHVGQITVNGFAGPIEIILGVDNAGAITGLSIGGSGFAETAGLGTKVREEAFTSQFVGLSSTPKAGKGVDTLSGATVSSSAVISGIGAVYDHLTSHIDGFTTPASLPAADNASEIAAQTASVMDAKDITVVAKGFGGDFDVIVSVNTDGTVAAVKIGEGFNENPDYGAKCLEDSFLSQFVGRGAGMSFGLDAVSGATGTSTTIVTAVNDALAKWAEEMK